MSTEDAQDSAAAARELRTRLERGLVNKRLTKTQLARRAGLGRTTVQQVFNPSARVPSAQTVKTLADALGLDADSLLALRSHADGAADSLSAEGATATVPGGLGRPIADWDPLDLEVHPAVEAPVPAGHSRSGGENGKGWAVTLPGYVRRRHDAELATLVAAAASGSSRMAVLIGSSSTGKTRACWEAVQPLAPLGWRLWHPYDPTHAEAALTDLGHIGPRTVVWLNEAQHYLGAGGGVGERIAAAVRALLTSPACGPVLVLGTLWPEFAHAYTTRPAPRQPDPHPQVRELLAGRQIVLPDHFDTAALSAARVCAEGGDRQLDQALECANDGRVTQFLAGAPELLHRYRTASPPARAVLQAAMDARRLGAGLHLSLALLAQAAEDYLTDDEYDALDDNWLEQTLAETSTTVHGNLAPLRRVRPRRTTLAPPPTATGSSSIYRLADYLEQHARDTRHRLCPPESFWQAAHDHVTNPDDLATLANAAAARYRHYWAHQLRLKAASTGHADALVWLVELRERAGERDEAERLAQQAADNGEPYALVRLSIMREKAGERDEAERLDLQAANAGHAISLSLLASRREEAGERDEAERLAQQAADNGYADALYHLAITRYHAGDWDEAERLAQQAISAGSTGAVVWLVLRWEEAGERDEAERLAQQAADTGYAEALGRLAERREEAGEHDEAERLAQQAANAGHAHTLSWLASVRKRAGERDKSERLAQQAADTGDINAVERLIQLREEAGERDEAERLAQQAAIAGDTGALFWLAQLRQEAGEHDEAERLAQQAINAGHAAARVWLVELRERIGEREEAEDLAQQAADSGDTDALAWLVELRNRAGEREEVERLVQQAANAGHLFALARLAMMREEAGERDEAERLCLQAADSGAFAFPSKQESLALTLWPHGLNPDGSPSNPW
ncbi:helix-turn-helix domain-containing protein [Streptomyces afghaniensis]|uniref:helix-turn-helix domain-containing protein n=1 Tax=Streptomyces afghaniensis TaxID=66865 RepID=UPI0037A399E7